MLATGWTWHELMDQPMYVRRFFWDLLCTRREAEAEANKRAAQG